MTDQNKPTDLSDSAMDDASGGVAAIHGRWKGFSLNGKGNTALSQGAFAEVSGLDSETEVIENAPPVGKVLGTNE